MDDAALGELVDDAEHLGQTLGGHGLIFQSTEVAQSIAHGLGIVSVLNSSFFARANSLFCRLVVCHFLNSCFLFLISIFWYRVRDSNPRF